MSFQSGIWYFDGRPVTPADAESMAAWTEHAGASPVAVSPAPGVCMGHSHGRQLFSGPAGTISFDGRLDNRPDLRMRFQDARSTAETSDAALALAAYEASAEEGPAALIGDFSLAVWDARRRALLLASDYAGTRPLYYSVRPDAVIWSTRLQALVDWLPEVELDDEYVMGLLTDGGAPNRTPYRGVYSVPPGHWVRVTPGGAHAGVFWELPAGNVIRYQRESDYEEHLRALFREAVRARCRDEVVLCELSGGFDSSSIVAMATDLIRSGHVPCRKVATVSVEHEGSRDRVFYEAVARACGVENHLVHTDEHPFFRACDPGKAMPEFWTALHAREAGIAEAVGASTCMTGLLGDAVMGNWEDDSSQVASLLRVGRIREALSTSLSWSRAAGVPVAGVLWRAVRGMPGDESPAETLAEHSLTVHWHKQASQGIEPSGSDWKQAPPERRKHYRCITQMLRQRKLQAPEAMGHLNFVHPFAHRPLVTFMLAIPAEVACSPGEPRRLMKRALGPLWPAILRKRRSKDAFAGVFLESLRPLAAELLKPGQRLQLVERGYVDGASLHGRLERLTLSLACNEPQLRQILLLEYWLRKQNVFGRAAGRISGPASTAMSKGPGQAADRSLQPFETLLELTQLLL